MSEKFIVDKEDLVTMANKVRELSGTNESYSVDTMVATMSELLTSPEVVQTIGNSEVVVMSQKAVTDSFAQKSYLVTVFEELKVAIAESNINEAVAILDNAILDLSTLS